MTRTLEDFKDQLVGFMTQNWDEAEVEAWKSELLALSGGEGEDLVDEAIEKAANAGEINHELGKSFDPDDSTEATQRYLDEEIESAFSAVERFWYEFVS